MNITDLFERSVAWFDAQVAQIKDDQWDDPTPCTEWNVRALLNHLVNEDLWTVPLFEGKTVPEVGDEFDGDLLGDDPKGAWAKARDAALAVGLAEGAAAKTVSVSRGDITGEQYLGELFNDHVIHGWDMARAIGADEKLDPELAQASYDMSKPYEDFMKKSGYFGDKIEVADDDELQTRLLAIFGRTA